MLLKAVFPGKYIQGEGALAQLPSWVATFGKKGLVLASRSSRETMLAPYRGELEAAGIAVEAFGGECCAEELGRLAEVIDRQGVDVLVGMGGGKAIDTAKITADHAGIPVIIVPTIASTDAPCSGCAVRYSKTGVFEAVQYQKTNPAVVLVDTAGIAAAPARFLVAGMGDALATWFEARSCHRTQSPNECGGLSTLAGLHLARLCYDTLLAHGEAALAAVRRHVVTPALDHIVEANILLSGLGFESSGLASAHAIHNGFTALAETHAFPHGEKVAFGLLAGLQLTDASPEEVETVCAFCEAVGLPTRLADIGLAGVSRERLRMAAEKACAPAEAIHHEAGKMTPEKVLSAILAADAMGEARMASAGSTLP